MIQGLAEALEKLQTTGASKHLDQSLRGIEKEGLRVSSEGKLSQRPHPLALGSALTHRYITTDFSESQIELITPACSSIAQTMDFLEQLHRYVYPRLEEELLWVSSMPCLLEGEAKIPIATYGSSLQGRLKHVYRQGLSYRYGKAMQTISGVHFNYSFTQAFWQAWGGLSPNAENWQNYINQSYFCILRNFLRVNWWLVLLFGSSPAVCNSFFQGRSHRLAVSSNHTAYGPYATSLRMSDLGYQNSRQQHLVVSHNDVQQYALDLQSAMKTIDPHYQSIGVKVDGEYRQLSAGVLQIENEYYGSIRPKRSVKGVIRPSDALLKHGVEYLEIRCLDLNPFEFTGVSHQQLEIVELLILHCLLVPSPPMSQQEFLSLRKNLESSVMNGANPALEFSFRGRQASIQEHAKQLFQELDMIATTLHLSNWPAIRDQLQGQLDDFSLLPSAKILSALSDQDCSFFEWAMSQSRLAADTLLSEQCDSDFEASLDQARVLSVELQKQLEGVQGSFDQYVKDFLS